jgi:hypothetical protein
LVDCVSCRVPTASCTGPTSRRPGYLPCVWLCLSFVSVMPVESGEVRVLGFWTLVRCDLLAAQPASSQRSVHAAEESFPMFLSPGARDMESGHMQPLPAVPAAHRRAKCLRAYTEDWRHVNRAGIWPALVCSCDSHGVVASVQHHTIRPCMDVGNPHPTPLGSRLITLCVHAERWQRLSG